MGRNHTPTDPDRSSIIVDIVDVLDDQGVASDSYHLHEYIDTDALVSLIDSANNPITVSFTVENVEVTVTKEGVLASHHE